MPSRRPKKRSRRLSRLPRPNQPLKNFFAPHFGSCRGRCATIEHAARVSSALGTMSCAHVCGLVIAMEERIISGSGQEDERTFELSLRPKFLKEYIGQQQVKDNLAIAVTATRSRGEAMDHVLLYGPP